MSLKSVLVSLIVAGVFAGLVLLSRGSSGNRDLGESAGTRTLGIDPMAVVGVRAQRDGSEDGVVRTAERAEGTVDTWSVGLAGAAWDADSTRVRTVLRALASATLVVDDEESIGEVFGTLSLVGRDGVTTDVRFGEEAAGGFVRAEVVLRGEDGIATERWFGRIERSLRDSLLGDGAGQGLAGWRSMDLFSMTVPEVVRAEVSAGGDSTTLERGSGGWRVVEPWDAGADGAMVQGMVGFVLALKAERFYDAALYSEDLTGLGDPIARIGLGTADGMTSIEIGTAVDRSGEEVFARYIGSGGNSAVLALSTAGLNRLTASGLGYVHQSAGEFVGADVEGVEILGAEGVVRLGFDRAVDRWETARGAASPSEGAAVDRLIGVLGSERAMRVKAMGDEDPRESASVGTVRVRTAGGAVNEFGVGIESVSGGMRLHISRGVGDGMRLVWVLGSEDAAGTGAWLAAVGAADGKLGGDE